MMVLAMHAGALGAFQADFRADSRAGTLRPKDVCTCMRVRICMRLRFLGLSGNSLQARRMLLRILGLRISRPLRMVTAKVSFHTRVRRAVGRACAEEART